MANRNHSAGEPRTPSPDETPCPCMTPDDMSPCRRHEPDELPGMWEPADVSGGETDTVPEHYYGVKVRDELRPNWNQPEASWWRQGVADALGGLIQNTLADLESTPIGYDEKTTGPLKLVGKCGCTWNATGTTRTSMCGPHRRIRERNRYGNKRGKTGE